MTSGADERVALTVREAARLARVSPSTMYRAIHAGHVPVVQFGGRYWVPRSKLEQLLSGDAPTPDAS
jgi:excisionase family DNA binding protein